MEKALAETYYFTLGIGGSEQINLQGVCHSFYYNSIHSILKGAG